MDDENLDGKRRHPENVYVEAGEAKDGSSESS